MINLHSITSIKLTDTEIAFAWSLTRYASRQVAIRGGKLFWKATNNERWNNAEVHTKPGGFYSHWMSLQLEDWIAAGKPGIEIPVLEND